MCHIVVWLINFESWIESWILNLDGQVPRASPLNSNQLEFVGRVNGTNIYFGPQD